MSQNANGALAAAQRELARVTSALEPIEGVGLDAWLRSDRDIPAADRVAIYRHAYFARIHTVLCEDYVALRAALGDDAFQDLARLYLMAHPPGSFSLRFAGERLRGFLAGSVAAAFLRRWPFAADLAALEWALVDAFDAADSTPLGRESLSGLAPEVWGGLRFALAPATRILALAWPVQELRKACDREIPIPAIAPAATALLVYRRAEQVFHRELSHVEEVALAEVSAGGDLAEVCARVELETSPSEAPGIAVSLLERWLADGILSGLQI